jgi:adenosine deaminase
MQPLAAPAPVQTQAQVRALAQALPKVLLHDHLDGGLRVGTLLALLAQRRLPAPVDSEDALSAWFDTNAHAGSLEKYLEGFALTVAAMATPDALERVAFEAAEDARAQGVLLAEFRIAPLLFEPFGISGDAAVEALLAGLRRGERSGGSVGNQSPATSLHRPLHCGLIVCAMRHLPPSETHRAAELALRWAGRGVIAFDLAGAERGHPPSEHAEALALVRRAGLPMTLHAGEADAAERVLEAAQHGATRIGHGVHLASALRDPARRHLVDEAIRLGLHLEVCPTSNVHTGVAPSMAQHPITALWQAGLSLSWHTDNTLMSRTSQTEEAVQLLLHTPLSAADLLRMSRLAAQASFLGETAKAEALRRIDAHHPHLD